MDQIKPGWQALTGQKPPNYQEPEILAEINVKIYGVEKGRSQVQVIPPQSPLAEGIKRLEAYSRLLTIIV